MRRGRSSERRRAIIAGTLLLLAAATQLVATQLARGQRVPGLPDERFVSPAAGLRAVSLELRAQAAISGGEVRLKHVARWSDEDAAANREIAELVLLRLDQAGAQSVDVHQIKGVLRDAGINLGSIIFTGAMSCKVTSAPDLAPRPSASVLPVEALAARLPAPSVSHRTLREVLTNDLADQLGIPIDSLQIRFESRDEKLLDLTDAEFQFAIEPRKVRRLGEIVWNVVLARSTDRQPATIRAHARAWQTQVIAARPIAFRQELSAGDLSEQRVLVDRVGDEARVSIAQAMGQSAGRDMPIGTPITAGMLHPPQCARVGQFINVTIEHASVRVIWTGEARESGARGQTIRVRKPGTREEFTVLLTGPEQARLIGGASTGGNSKLAAIR